VFMIPCKRLQAVQLVSRSAVEAVVVNACYINSVTTNDCRQLECRVAVVYVCTYLCVCVCVYVSLLLENG